MVEDAADFWPLCSSNLYILEYGIWSTGESKACAASHPDMVALTTAVEHKWVMGEHMSSKDMVKTKKAIMPKLGPMLAEEGRNDKLYVSAARHKLFSAQVPIQV